jgi:mono/diheme cytochrome c family protein
MLVFLGLLVGCGSDGGGGTPDASVPVPDAPVVVPDASAAMLVARGDYLVNHVAACGDCHTPRNADGTPDQTKALSGIDCFLDTAPDDPNMGCLASRNLTNDPTGLANRTDQQIRDMFQKGIRPGGQFLNAYMPYSVFANMTDDDALSVVAYLRTVPGVSHAVAASQPPWDNPTSAAPQLIPDLIPRDPNETNSTANGRYLAAMAGICIICHTPLSRPARRSRSICRRCSPAGRTSSPASRRRRSRRTSTRATSRPTRPASPATPPRRS